MKSKIVICLILLVSVARAQSLESLKPLMQKMHDANYNMDFEAIADFTFPAAVTLLGGREAFLEKLDHDYQNTDFRKRIQLERPAFNFGEIIKTGEQQFCVITFYNPIRYFFENPLDASSGPKIAADLLDSTHAIQSTYEPKRNTVNLRRNSKFLAIADATTNNQWKFIDLDDPQQNQIVSSLLNENIKTAIGL